MLDLRNLDYDIDLTGFDTHEIDELLLAQSEDAHEDDAPPAPENPASRAGDLWLCGKHRILCGDATSPEAVARLLGERKPRIMITDPPYGIELESEWRDRAGLNGCGPAEKSYIKHGTKGHNETTISGDTRRACSSADGSLSVRGGVIVHRGFNSEERRPPEFARSPLYPLQPNVVSPDRRVGLYARSYISTTGTGESYVAFIWGQKLFFASIPKRVPNGPPRMNVGLVQRWLKRAASHHWPRPSVAFAETPRPMST